MLKKENGIKKILIDENTVKQKVKELAQKINNDYKDKTPCLIGLLKGSFVFIADLAREIETNIEIDFMIVSSYGNDKIGSEIKILKDVDNYHQTIFCDYINWREITKQYFKKNVLFWAKFEIIAKNITHNNSFISSILDVMQLVN